MNKIKSIDIHFENCECFNLPSECIEFMNVEGFKTRYFMQSNHEGDYFKTNKAYYVNIKLRNSKDIKTYFNFGNKFFDRVKQYNDITSITYIFDNGKKFDFYVPWDFEDRQYNSWQRIKEFKDGSIIIEIKRRKNQNQK